MAVPQALRTSFSDLYGTSMLPVLEELFRSDYEARPMIRDQIFKKVDHDRDIWQYTELHDMPLFSAVSEGQDYSFNKPSQGYDSTITVVKYGLGFSISEEAVDDGKFDMIGDAVRKMAKSAHESQEQAAMDILNNGFSSTTTGDGLALFHASHTLPSGSTFRNKLSVAADLSYTSLQTAIQDFGKVFQGDSGIYEFIRPQTLLVANENRMYASELLGSDKMTDNNYNNMNSIKSEGLQGLSSPRLTDTDAWFLVASPADTGLRLIVRKPLETKAADPAVGFLNDAIYYKARYREKLGAVHPKGVFGTPGA